MDTNTTHIARKLLTRSTFSLLSKDQPKSTVNLLIQRICPSIHKRCNNLFSLWDLGGRISGLSAVLTSAGTGAGAGVSALEIESIFTLRQL